METALYFPYIRVPQTPWFTQVLLYWDQAASIIPRTIWADEDAIDPYMKELVRAGLFHAMLPDDGLFEVDHQGYKEGFLDLLRSRPSPTAVQEFTLIHGGKMSASLFMELKRQGLARGGRFSSGECLWEVEPGTAGLYMAYLAGAMSAAAPGTVPVTDRAENIGTLSGSTGTLTQKLTALRYRVISEALPSPRGPVPVKELRRFKDDNAEQLRRCRTYLDGRLADLAAMRQDELSEVRADAVLMEIKDDVEKLREQMNSRNWPGVTLVGFGGVMGTALAVAGDLVTGGAALALGLGIGAAALQAGAGGYSAVEMMRKPKYDARAPLDRLAPRPLDLIEGKKHADTGNHRKWEHRIGSRSTRRCIGYERGPRELPRTRIPPRPHYRARTTRQGWHG